MRQPIQTWQQTPQQRLGEVQQVAHTHHFKQLSLHPPHTLSLLTRQSSQSQGPSTIQTGVEVEDTPWQTLRYQVP